MLLESWESYNVAGRGHEINKIKHQNNMLLAPKDILTLLCRPLCVLPLLNKTAREKEQRELEAIITTLPLATSPGPVGIGLWLC
jgi:hypothetical protein